MELKKENVNKTNATFLDIDIKIENGKLILNFTIKETILVLIL